MTIGSLWLSNTVDLDGPYLYQGSGDFLIEMTNYVSSKCLKGAAVK